MKAVWKKEMGFYFETPFGYFFTGIFLILSGLTFTLFNLLQGSSSLAGMFDLMKNFMFIIIPVLTMKMFAEERKNGTEHLLLTSALTERDIVLGKFLAAVTLFLSSLAVTLIYVLIIAVYGYADAAAVIVSYLGFILLGISMTAVCTFTASFAESQVTSAIVSFGVLFLMVSLTSFTGTVKIPVLTKILTAFAITRYYDDFTLGTLSAGPVLYYLGVTAVCLCMAVKNLEYRRFR